ncbi:MAG: xanthine dehydrogenase molybdopterin binding subunit [Ectothiorhodospiraceae bacterium]|nr:xanthine dehydrogenase molybdopterin binding subunit [Ectothiorhodospiraceae bacterium]
MSRKSTEASAGKPVKHESAQLHVTGRARYTDDIPLPPNTLHVAFGLSTVAHGRIVAMDLAPVREAPGVVAVFTAEDVPGDNNYSPAHDDPIFAEGHVHFLGQQLFAVAATSYQAARKAARLAKIDYEELPAILDIPSALAAESYVLPTRTLHRGDPAAALETAPRRLRGQIAIGGQDHFYLEGQVAAALPQDDGGMIVWSSTQHPSEVQHMVGHALGRHCHDVVIQCRRMGGGFGGKESQPALFACVAAIVAARTGRPAKVRLDRDDDMVMTGKRHDFLAEYEVGFDEQGRISALDLMLASRCGYSADLSAPVNDRAMFHADNCYYLEHVRIVSHRCRTNTVSNTAFRGFGGPQGMMAIEAVIDDVARHLALDPLDVRRINYYGIGERDLTPYWMRVEDNILEDLTTQLEESSAYRTRREAIAAFNEGSPVIKRGIALTPVKFGISFTATQFNQAGALVHIYTDGTVLLNHGGTEMGQGLYTKVAQVVAEELGLPLDRVRVSATDTSKIPNTSATAASSGSDLNGKAAQAAARTIRQRLVDLLAERYRNAPEGIRFDVAIVHIGDDSLPFKDVVTMAYNARVSLSSTGFYRTPKIHYDKDSLRGRPFFYFAYGAAVTEVAIDTLTGEHRMLRVDVLHDVGRSLNPALDIGQIEGGFLQGAGWLTSEELHWDDQGSLKTHAPSTYKIPAVGDWPREAHIRLLENAPNREETIFRSKAVGEPPLMLAMSVFHALRDAVAATSGPRAATALSAPATPEAVLRALETVTATDAETGDVAAEAGA